MSNQISPRLARWAPLLLRLIVGYGFAVHGIAKLSRGPGSFAGILQSLGVPAPHLMAWVTILSELLGGIAVGTGAFVTIFSVPLAAILLVAIFTVHLPYGFSSIKLIAVTQTGAQFGPPGYECNLLYLAALVALVLGGPGPLAVDALLKRTKRNRPAGTAGSDIVCPTPRRLTNFFLNAPDRCNFAMIATSNSQLPRAFETTDERRIL